MTTIRFTEQIKEKTGHLLLVLSFTLIPLIPVNTNAAVYKIGTSGIRYSREDISPSYTEMMTDLKFTAIFKKKFSIGLLYNMNTFASGSTTEAASHIGVTLGYHFRRGYFVDMLAFVSGSRTFTGAPTYGSATGFGTDIGLYKKLFPNIEGGIAATYRQYNYGTPSDSSGTTQSIKKFNPIMFVNFVF